MEFGNLFPPFFAFEEVADGLQSCRGAGEIFDSQIQMDLREEPKLAFLHGFQVALPF